MLSLPLKPVVKPSGWLSLFGWLLTDLSDSSSSEKRIYMLKRIVQDICFIVYGVIVKYRMKFYNKND